jgi:DNA end-binding protein Ku
MKGPLPNPLTYKKRPVGCAVGGVAEPAKAEKPAKPAKKPRKVSSGQKEMLMPIEGKKPKEAAAKKPAAKPQRKSA